MITSLQIFINYLLKYSSHYWFKGNCTCIFSWLTKGYNSNFSSPSLSPIFTFYISLIKFFYTINKQLLTLFKITFLIIFNNNYKFQHFWYFSLKNSRVSVTFFCKKIYQQSFVLKAAARNSNNERLGSMSIKGNNSNFEFQSAQIIL